MVLMLLEARRRAREKMVSACKNMLGFDLDCREMNFQENDKLTDLTLQFRVDLQHESVLQLSWRDLILLYVTASAGSAGKTGCYATPLN